MKEDFRQVNDVARLESSGNSVFTYDADRCQLSFNKEKNEYGVFFSDSKLNDMANYFIVKLNAKPVEGESVKGDVTWTEEKRLVTKNLRFEVLKCSADGRIWLWNSGEAIGIIVKNLE